MTANGGTRNGPREWAHETLLTALLFMLVYNLVFTKAPSLSGGRIVLIGLTAAYPALIWERWMLFFRSYSVTVWSLVGICAYSAILSFFSGDWGQTSRLAHFLLLSVFGAVAWAAVEEGRTESPADSFIRRFAIVATLQSILVFVSLFTPGFRVWVAGLLVRGGNINLLSAMRPAGFSNSGGAALSVIQALGVYAAFVAASNSRQKAPWNLSALICGLASAINGRTGLLLVAAAIPISLVASKARGSLTRNLAVGFVLILLLWPFAITRFRESIPEGDAIITSAEEIFVEGSGTASVQNLSDMPIPPITDDTFAGTGRVGGDYGNASGNDSGYVQTYYALGIPMSVLFYSLLFFLCMGLVLRVQGDRLVLLQWLTVAMFLIETKEPFVFKYVMPFFIFTTAWAATSKTYLRSMVPSRRPVTNRVETST